MQNQVQIRIPEQVNSILETIQGAGYETYVVGGCVRDALLGREPHDWDITTSALPGQVKKLFPRTIDTGLKHGTVTVMCGAVGYEVTTFRVDGVYEDGRHPKEVTFTPSLEEDLKRRDFTINAMAYDGRGGLIDLFGGQKDLERGLIRAVGDPAQRFSEDALRIMRAVRFSAQLGYEIEEATLKAASDLAPNLQKISAERIREELEKTLMSVSLVRKDRVLRLSMLLHDMGKPACRTTDEKGIDHFYGHADVGYEMARSILKRLKYDNATIRQVLPIVKWHDMQVRLTEPAVRRAVVKIGEDLFPLFLEVKQADMLAQSTFQREEKQEILDTLGGLYSRIIERGDCLNLKDLTVKGSDLIALGIRPGKEMGTILTQMLEDVLNVPEHNNKEYLVKRFAHFTG